MIRGLVFSFRIFDRRAIYCESSSFGGLLFGKGEHWCCDGSCCLPFYGMCATAPTPPSPLTLLYKAMPTQEVFSFFLVL